MRKRMVRILCGLLTACMLTGCGAAEKVSEDISDSAAIDSLVASILEREEEEKFIFVADGEVAGLSENDSEYTNISSKNHQGNVVNAKDEGTGEIIFDNAAYVLIYNPLIYDENANDPTMTNRYSGYLGKQIVTGISRADDNDGTALVLPYNQPTPAVDLGNDRTGTEYTNVSNRMDPTYSVGDKHDFFYSLWGDPRTYGTFTCMYEGKYCYIWSINKSIDKKLAKQLGNTFDTQIYEQELEKFGTPRFVSNGGKVHVLFTPLAAYGYGGFFTWSDIESSDWMSEAEAKERKYNLDHAIINISSDGNNNPEYQGMTMAHELQHLICASEHYYGNNPPYITLWLNEAMSAYAEEFYAPGSKDKYGNGKNFYYSERYRSGQSLFDFGVDYVAENGKDMDTGAYGAVYLFEEYLRNLAGDDVFSKIHRFWRESSSVSEANALINSVPAHVKDAIDGNYQYPQSLSDVIGRGSNVWMSKMALDYAISMVSSSPVKCEIYAKEASYKQQRYSAAEWMNLLRQNKLFDREEGSYIEGGGSIFIATEDGTYAKPNNAAKELIYVAFDADFKVIGTSLQEDANEGSTGEKTNSGYDTSTPFTWNQNMTVNIFSGSAGSKDSCHQVMLEGIQETLSKEFFQLKDWNKGSGEAADLKAVKSIVNGSEVPGVMIIQYSDTASNAEEMRKVIAEARNKGVAVLTYGPDTIDEKRIFWGAHFDHSQMLPTATDLAKYTAGDGVFKTGKTIGEHLLKIIDGEKDHIKLSYKKK